MPFLFLELEQNFGKLLDNVCHSFRTRLRDCGRAAQKSKGLDMVSELSERYVACIEIKRIEGRQHNVKQDKGKSWRCENKTDFR